MIGNCAVLGEEVVLLFEHAGFLRGCSVFLRIQTFFEHDLCLPLNAPQSPRTLLPSRALHPDSRAL